ncbi:sensor histidine kinase [Andreprevotia chitinilytica]|uniref:sensor histidine kinase n=1 Tax=Andreprevotia chitinilytica TaxID=396808 RepID=UPI000550AD16|nr:histidine kinase [Andreprevotia chitinilytica]
MKTRLTDLDPRQRRKRALTNLGLLLLINNLIGLYLTSNDPYTPFWHYFIISNAVGLSIDASGHLLHLLVRDRMPIWLYYIIAVPIGMTVGFKLAAMLGAKDVLALVTDHFESSGHWVLISTVLISVAACTFFYLYHSRVEIRLALEAERSQRAEAQQAEAIARLGMLQAQIEPHFLFNTLANVQSLIERDPPAARAMLEQLNRYLRASLARTRRPDNTLADELQLVTALLEIARMRLGDRLSYRVDIPTALHALPMPPLLLQPLVENALEHGIEPAIAGGEIVIDGRQDGDTIILRVLDSGLGLTDTTDSDGVGLANIRARLDQLYGARGRLALYPNTPSGVIAELTLPCSQDKSTG